MIVKQDYKKLLNFILEVGKLKGEKRKGWLIHKIKSPETTAEHIFHLAFLVWFLGKKKKINLEKAIKMALIHDLCEVYAPDFTPYHAKAIKEKGRVTIKEALSLKPITGRPTNIQRKKLEKIKQKLETKAMKKLSTQLPPDLKNEMNFLWLDFNKELSWEAKFVKQADKIINLLQGLEYWKKYGKIQHQLWIRRAKEVLDDPDLLEFFKIMENKFCRKNN